MWDSAQRKFRSRPGSRTADILSAVGKDELIHIRDDDTIKAVTI